MQESEDTFSKHNLLGRAKSGLTNDETLMLHKMNTGQQSLGRNSPVSNKWINSNHKSLTHLTHFEAAVDHANNQNNKVVFNNRGNYEIIDITSGLQSAVELEQLYTEKIEEEERKTTQMSNIYRQNSKGKHEFENEALCKSLGSVHQPLSKDQSQINTNSEDIIDKLIDNQDHFQSYFFSHEVKEASSKDLIKISDQMSVQNLRRNLKQTQNKSAFRKIASENKFGQDQGLKPRQTKSTQKFKTKLYKDLNKSMLIMQVRNTGQMKINRYMSQEGQRKKISQNIILEQRQDIQTSETNKIDISKADTKHLQSHTDDFEKATDMLNDQLCINKSHRDNVKYLNLKQFNSIDKIMESPHSKMTGDRNKDKTLNFHLTNYEDTQRISKKVTKSKSPVQTEENQSNTVKSSSQFNFKLYKKSMPLTPKSDKISSTYDKNFVSVMSPQAILEQNDQINEKRPSQSQNLKVRNWIFDKNDRKNEQQLQSQKEINKPPSVLSIARRESSIRKKEGHLNQPSQSNSKVQVNSVQNSKKMSPSPSKKGVQVNGPEFAIQQRKISAVNLIIRNRKVKDSIEDQSQDKMIKHIDLEQYIQHENNLRNANNQDLKSLDSIRDQNLVNLNQEIRNGRNLELNELGRPATKEISTGAPGLDDQYHSDVVFSKVSPTSDDSTVNNIDENRINKTNKSPNKLESVYKVNHPTEKHGHMYFGDDGRTPTPNCHKEVIININIEKPKPQSFSDETKVFDSSLEQDLTPLNSTSNLVQENFDHIELQIEQDKTTQELINLKKIRQQKEELLNNQYGQIQVTGKGIQGKQQNLIQNQKRNQINIVKQNMNYSHPYKYGEEEHIYQNLEDHTPKIELMPSNKIRNIHETNFNSLSFDAQQKQKPKTGQSRQKGKTMGTPQKLKNNLSNNNMDMSQASTLKRNSSLEGNEKSSNYYKDASPISEVKYKVSLKSKTNSKLTKKGGLKQQQMVKMQTQKIQNQADYSLKQNDQCLSYISHDVLPNNLNKQQSRSINSDSYSIILTNHQLTQKGIDFSQLEENQKTMLLVQQHQILQMIQEKAKEYRNGEMRDLTNNSPLQRINTCMTNNVKGHSFGLMRNLSQLNRSAGEEHNNFNEFGLICDVRDGGNLQESFVNSQKKRFGDDNSIEQIGSNNNSNVQSQEFNNLNSRNNDKFDARHTGVGTDDLENLIQPISRNSPSDLLCSNNIEFAVQEDTASAANQYLQSKSIQNSVSNQTVSNFVSHQLEQGHIFNQNQLEYLNQQQTLIEQSTLNISRFQNFLHGLSSAQKKYLYDKQLEKAYEYHNFKNDQIMDEVIRSSSPGFNKRPSSQMNQVYPRVIIHNIMGQNKIVQIDPKSGNGQDLGAKLRQRQTGLLICGESVEVIKGTGPGTIMGIIDNQKQESLMKHVNQPQKTKRYQINIQTNTLSTGQTKLKAQVINKGKSKMSPASLSPRSVGSKTSIYSKNAILKNMRDVRLTSKSIENIRRQHQLLCDTVIKKKSIINHDQPNILVADQSQIGYQISNLNESQLQTFGNNPKWQIERSIKSNLQNKQLNRQTIDLQNKNLARQSPKNMTNVMNQSQNASNNLQYVNQYMNINNQSQRQSYNSKNNIQHEESSPMFLRSRLLEQSLITKVQSSQSREGSNVHTKEITDEIFKTNKRSHENDTEPSKTHFDENNILSIRNSNLQEYTQVGIKKEGVYLQANNLVMISIESTKKVVPHAHGVIINQTLLNDQRNPLRNKLANHKNDNNDIIAALNPNKHRELSNNSSHSHSQSLITISQNSTAMLAKNNNHSPPYPSTKKVKKTETGFNQQKRPKSQKYKIMPKAVHKITNSNSKFMMKLSPNQTQQYFYINKEQQQENLMNYQNEETRSMHFSNKTADGLNNEENRTQYVKQILEQRISPEALRGDKIDDFDPGTLRRKSQAKQSGDATKLLSPTGSGNFNLVRSPQREGSNGRIHTQNSNNQDNDEEQSKLYNFEAKNSEYTARKSNYNKKLDQGLFAKISNQFRNAQFKKATSNILLKGNQGQEAVDPSQLSSNGGKMVIANLLTNFQTYYRKDKQRESYEKSANEVVAFSNQDDALISPYFTLERSDGDKSIGPYTCDGKALNSRDLIIKLKSENQKSDKNQDFHPNATTKEITIKQITQSDQLGRSQIIPTHISKDLQFIDDNHSQKQNQSGHRNSLQNELDQTSQLQIDINSASQMQDPSLYYMMNQSKYQVPQYSQLGKKNSEFTRSHFDTQSQGPKLFKYQIQNQQINSEFIFTQPIRHSKSPNAISSSKHVLHLNRQSRGYQELEGKIIQSGGGTGPVKMKQSENIRDIVRAQQKFGPPRLISQNRNNDLINRMTLKEHTGSLSTKTAAGNRMQNVFSQQNISSVKSGRNLLNPYHSNTELVSLQNLDQQIPLNTQTNFLQKRTYESQGLNLYKPKSQGGGNTRMNYIINNQQHSLIGPMNSLPKFERFNTHNLLTKQVRVTSLMEKNDRYRQIKKGRVQIGKEQITNNKNFRS